MLTAWGVVQALFTPVRLKKWDVQGKCIVIPVWLWPSQGARRVRTMGGRSIPAPRFPRPARPAHVSDREPPMFVLFDPNRNWTEPPLSQICEAAAATPVLPVKARGTGGQLRWAELGNLILRSTCSCPPSVLGKNSSLYRSKCLYLFWLILLLLFSRTPVTGMLDCLISSYISLTSHYFFVVVVLLRPLTGILRYCIFLIL